MFGMKLRNSSYSRNYQYKDIIEIANKNSDYEPYGYKKEFIELVKMTKDLIK